MKLRRIELLMVWCVLSLAAYNCAAATNEYEYTQKSSWVGSMLASREKLTRQKGTAIQNRIPRLGRGDFTVMAWVRTEDEGVLFSKTQPEKPWLRGAKMYCIFDDDLVYEIRDADRHSMRAKVLDGQWHHIAISSSNNVHTLYLDGKRSHSRPVNYLDEPDGSVFQIGYMAPGFPRDIDGFKGMIDEMRIYNRGVSDSKVKTAFAQKLPEREPGLIGYFSFEGSTKDMSGTGNNPVQEKGVNYGPGKFGQALKLEGNGARIVLAAEDDSAFLEGFWSWASNIFSDARSVREMGWEKEDGIWKEPWKPGEYMGLIQAYTRAAYRDSELQAGLLQ